METASQGRQYAILAIAVFARGRDKRLFASTGKGANLKPISLFAAAVAASTVVAACSAKDQTKPSLGGACQFAKCICSHEEAYFWQLGDSVPIQWGENGQASCPEGYVLIREKDENK
jgi:hypothetical protein